MTAVRTPPAVAPKDLSQEALLAAIDRPIKRVWHSPLYALGLLVVAIAMVLLPVIYLGLIAGACYGVYWHAVEHAGMITGGRMVYFRILGYLIPLVSGVIIVVFMLKPLLARPASSEKRVSLMRENDPVVFAFVDRLCEVVGSPKPRRIDISCEVNAAAFFRHGWLSMLGRDLALEIGAPIVAGLNLQQLAGVLAHEFGHFGQRLGMRASYIIRRINGWFYRLVYERDAWDEKLSNAHEHTDSTFLMICALIAQVGVWLSRKILWVLLMVGHLISCGFMRQMEYDADQYQARLVGTDAFVSTTHRMQHLIVASVLVHEDLWDSWKDGRLGDDFCRLLIAKADSLPADKRGEIEKELSDEGGWFDTHPKSADRMRRAEREQADGVFSLDVPATVLFRDFEGLSKAVTFSYYRQLCGPRFGPANLISTEGLTRRQKDMTRGREAADRFFQGCITPLRPIYVDRHSAHFKLTPKQAVARLKKARERLAASLAVVQKAYKQYADSQEVVAKAETARVFLSNKARIVAEDFGLSAGTLPAARAAREQADRSIRSIEDKLAASESLFRARLECSLMLLNVDRVASRIKSAEARRSRVGRLLEALGRHHAAWPEIEQLRQSFMSLDAYYRLLSDGIQEESVVAQTVDLMHELRGALNQLHRCLHDDEYPFDHASGRVTLAKFAIGKMPPSDDLVGTLLVVDRTIENMDHLYLRIVGELAETCEWVEAAVGLPPMKAPKREKPTPVQPADSSKSDPPAKARD